MSRAERCRVCGDFDGLCMYDSDLECAVAERGARVALSRAGQETMKLLVDGHIPAGEACPWADQCALKMDKCPTREMPRDVPFSCASARAFDLIKTPSGSPLDTIFGKWPGDESDEQIAKALRKIP